MDYETTLRCIGYALDFCWAILPVAILGALTWRLTR
jgi:hypothetical protein